MDGFGPWQSVEYVPGVPTAARDETTPLFACRTLGNARAWAELFMGVEIWRCEVRSKRSNALAELRSMAHNRRWFDEREPWLVTEVTLTERVEA